MEYKLEPPIISRNVRRDGKYSDLVAVALKRYKDFISNNIILIGGSWGFSKHQDNIWIVVLSLARCSTVFIFIAGDVVFVELVANLYFDDNERGLTRVGQTMLGSLGNFDGLVTF